MIWCTQHIVVGSVGQWVVKPLLGLVLALTMVPMLGLPNAVGTGLILVRTPAVAALLTPFYPLRVSPALADPPCWTLAACLGDETRDSGMHGTDAAGMHKPGRDRQAPCHASARRWRACRARS